MAKSKHNKSLYSTSAFRFLLLTAIVAVSLVGIKNLAINYQNNNVLGEASFLADKGSDSGESSGDSNSGRGFSGGNDSSKSSDENRIENEDLDTPEPIEAEDEDEAEDEPEEQNISQFSLENLKELRVRTEPNKTRIRLDSAGGRFELKSEDGKLKIKIKQEDGDEFELENDTLDDINEALEDEGISVATSSGNRLRIRRGLFEAETHFPLSINPTTNQLTVTTPAGEKNVAVLPDQAVANLFRLKFIDRIASGSAAENPTGIKLGLLNNNPVFQVLGVDEQKLLGFITVSVNKTSFVSAENGQIVRVDATFLNRLLDLFSI